MTVEPSGMGLVPLQKEALLPFPPCKNTVRSQKSAILRGPHLNLTMLAPPESQTSSLQNREKSVSAVYNPLSL